MLVGQDDFEDWQEEQTVREFENAFTHSLDFQAWEEELLTPDLANILAGAGLLPPRRQ